MNHSDLELQLLARLRAKGKSAVAIGVDLGTTKTSVARAHFDGDAGTLTCECLRFAQGDGTNRVAVPSAVAITEDGSTIFGAPALALRGKQGTLAEKNLFYETKNLIGLRYTYARAPKEFRTPTEIASQLLNHLREGFDDPLTSKAKLPVVLAVPASFHGAQRTATMCAAVKPFAAKCARDVRLIDEPYAAFLDLKFRSPDRADALLREGANILVFDFGGGTCDVAIFHIDAVRGGTLGARLVGTSRYHRLGGGDIDRAIVHDVLIPRLIEENGIDRFELSWYDKRRKLEPRLLEVAERLKIALSHRLAALRAAGLPASDDEVARSVEMTVDLNDQILTLNEPSLSVEQFNKLMRPFLDSDPPPEAGDEYVQRSSLFAPIAQALLRARLEPDDIHGVLLCGSSSLLPTVQDALKKQFPESQHVLLGNAEELQGTVARGAALQALSLQVLGEPIIAPVCSADLSLRVVTGAVPLLAAGDAVPNASRAQTILRPPRNSKRDQVPLAVEVVADNNRVVGRSLWTLPAPVSTNDRLALEWTLDDNQCIELHLTRMDDPNTDPFVHRFDAPIMHRDPGQIVRCRMLEREEDIRNDKIPRADFGNAFEKHARDCAALGEFEKALHFVGLAMQEQGQTQNLFNLRGVYRERIGDRDGAMDSYHQAGDWSTTKFNSGLLHYKSGQLTEALADVDFALQNEANRAYHSLRGDILKKMGKNDEARLEWQDAIAGTPDLAELSDFQLGWIESAARELDDKAMLERVRDARSKLAQRTERGEREGVLPALAQADDRPAAREIL